MEKEQISAYNSYLMRRAKLLAKNNTIENTTYTDLLNLRKIISGVTQNRIVLSEYIDFLYKIKQIPTSTDSPESIKKILNTYFPYSTNINLNNAETAGLLEMAIRATDTELIFLSDKLVNVYEAIAAKDEKFAEKFLCIKGHIAATSLDGT